MILLLSHGKGGSVGLALNKHCKLDLEPGEGFGGLRGGGGVEGLGFEV